MSGQRKVTAFSPLKKYRVRAVIAPIFKLLECVCELLVPFIVKEIIDYGLTNVPYTGWGYTFGWTGNDSMYRNDAFVFGLTGLLFALALLGFGMTMVTQWLSADVATKFGRDLRNEIHTHIGKISVQQLNEYGRNKALNVVTSDTDNLLKGLNSFMRLLVRAPFLVIGSVVASFLLSPIAGYCVLGALALCAVVLAIVLLSTPKRYASLQGELDRLSSKGEDDIVGGKVIRAFNKQKEENEEFEKITETYKRKSISLAKINSILNPLTFGFINIGIVIVLYLGSYQLEKTGLTVGTIVAVISFFTQSLAALFQFATLVTNLSKAASSKRRIDAFLAIEPSIVDGPINEIEEGKEGDPLYEFKDVSLSFGGESKALDSLNFTIYKGQKIGFIGGTGSGKSTIIALLERFYDPTGGLILYKGQPLKDYSLNALRQENAIVLQRPELFKGTIRSNITLGNPNATEEDIEDALRKSLAYEFVSRYKDGVDHPVEENGTNFSGGQRQRILIARALLAHRPNLILDDSTSALDYKSDLEVRRNVASIKGLTTVLVSQRATSIKDCDEIFVLDNGKIVGRGKHNDLLSSCPIYREIYETQVSQQ